MSLTQCYFHILIQSFHLKLTIRDDDIGFDDDIAVMEFSPNIMPGVNGSVLSNYTMPLHDGTAM